MGSEKEGLGRGREEGGGALVLGHPCTYINAIVVSEIIARI